MHERSERVGPGGVTAEALAAWLGTDDEPFLLDVRQPEEVAEWSIAGALNIPLGELQHRLGEVPSDRPVVVVCRSGNRSARAAEMLIEAGHQPLNLLGGMGAWAQAYDLAEARLSNAQIVQVRRRGKGCLSYLIGSGDEAFVIDPSTRIDLYAAAVEQRSWRISRVFDTHLHADHVSGARALTQLTGARLHLHPDDRFNFPYEPLRDDQRFALPGRTELSVATSHSPGHTRGSVMFKYGEEAVFTGDTVFVDAIGRPDLAGHAQEFARDLYNSLQEHVLTRADAAAVYPAHFGPRVQVVPGVPVSTCIRSVRGMLQSLVIDEESFVRWATTAVAEQPSNFFEIVRANMGRTSLRPDEIAELECGPNRCAI